MTMSSPTEQLVEDVASVYFSAIGAAIKRGVEIDLPAACAAQTGNAGERADPSQCVLQGRLGAALHRLNSGLPHDTIEGVVRTLTRPPHPTLVQNNRWFHALLTDGVEVEYRDAKSGETRGGPARLVDFDNPGANDLLVVRQLTITVPSGTAIRPDLILFLNGLPIVVIELKDPTDTRTNLGIVMADEAHRSQYGFVEGGARWMREALPNATFVGFTGTPLERDDKNTIHVFGEYADVYDIRQAVEDGATKPLYYESRIIKLRVDEEGARAAEEEVEYFVNADRSGEPADEKIRVSLELLVGAQEWIERLAAFIVEHWEKRRAAMEGKAMVVTMSRDIAARLYEAIRALRPDWHDANDERGAMKVVVTGATDDPEPLRTHVRTKAARKRLAERFKAPDDDLRLVILCDMWLTGFDCPPAHTMYLDKPLAGHNLMQAIARVNRVYGEKPGGLIVDLLGLADQLADALATYTQAGGTGEAVRKVQDEAVPAMQAAFEKLRAFFHGCDYEEALDAAPQDVLPVYLRAIDHALGQTDGWKRLQLLVKELSVAFALAVPRRETETIAPHLAFFQHAVAMIRKQLADDTGSGDRHGRQRDIDVAVRQVIGGAVDADEVIDLFAVAGLQEARLDILSDEFLGPWPYWSRRTWLWRRCESC